MRSTPGTTHSTFDPGRAFLMYRDIFAPFYVESTRPLRDALAGGVLREDVPLLVVDRGAGATALITRQLTYHHVAQGETRGRSWMVSF